MYKRQTTWSGNHIKRSDVEVAKNYLDEKELDALNKIVTAYLDIAEVHALNQEPCNAVSYTHLELRRYRKTFLDNKLSR